VATSLRLTPELSLQLREEARRTGRSQASIVSQAVDEKLNGKASASPLPDCVEPPAVPFRRTPPERLIDDGGQLNKILDDLKEDRI